MDADGMADMYEIKYGCVNSDMSDPDTPGGYVSNTVQGQGWQHPYVHNARYAVLIGVGSGEAGKNWPSFWNDVKLMYEVLVDQYNYLDENIYLHFWDSKKDDKGGIVDGPADWDVPDEYKNEWGDGIKQNIEILAGKITKNDLFIFFATSHGLKSPEKKGAGSFELCDIPEISSSAITYANPEAGNNIDREIDKLSYTRAILIFSACASGTAIHGTDEHPGWNLKDNNRIILTDTDKNEESYSEWWWPGDRHDHSAFLYEGHLDFILLPDDLDSYYSGFLKNMENTNDPRSVKYAYDKGNEAATYNEESPGKIYESHPQITLPDLASKTYW